MIVQGSGLLVSGFSFLVAGSFWSGLQARIREEEQQQTKDRNPEP